MFEKIKWPVGIIVVMVLISFMLIDPTGALINSIKWFGNFGFKFSAYAYGAFAFVSVFCILPIIDAAKEKRHDGIEMTANIVCWSVFAYFVLFTLFFAYKYNFTPVV